MSIKAVNFDAFETQAALDGRKTMFRRVITPKYGNTHIRWFTNKYGTRLVEMQNDIEGETFGKNEDGTTWHKFLYCHELNPKYRPGDILWVRETWNGDWCDHVIYKADGGSAKEAGYSAEPKWRSSSNMPREACRLFLRVTDVRAEKLWKMNDVDAKEEGFVVEWGEFHFIDEITPVNSNKAKFGAHWNKRYAKCGHGWDTNPWVFAYAFEVCEKPEGWLKA